MSFTKKELSVQSRYIYPTTVALKKENAIQSAFTSRINFILSYENGKENNVSVIMGKRNPRTSEPQEKRPKGALGGHLLPRYHILALEGNLRVCKRVSKGFKKEQTVTYRHYAEFAKFVRDDLPHGQPVTQSLLQW